MKHLKTLSFFLLSIALLSCSESPSEKKAENWQALFNGEDLSGWDLKISGHELNDNYNNTFRVEEGIIKVNYDDYDTFDEDFGHLFYETPYSHYRLRMDYRIFGEPTPGSPVWAYANSGVMLHSQSAESMELNQNFPISVEMQFLSALDSSARATGNLASPGTHVVVDGEMHTDHMLYSSANTYQDEWVHVEAIVLGDSIVHHVVEGDTVLTYSMTQIGGWELEEEVGWVDDKTFVKEMVGTALKKGYIALQAEGHPVWFKNVEILDLSGDYK